MDLTDDVYDFNSAHWGIELNEEKDGVDAHVLKSFNRVKGVLKELHRNIIEQRGLDLIEEFYVFLMKLIGEKEQAQIPLKPRFSFPESEKELKECVNLTDEQIDILKPLRGKKLISLDQLSPYMERLKLKEIQYQDLLIEFEVKWGPHKVKQMLLKAITELLCHTRKFNDLGSKCWIRPLDDEVLMLGTNDKEIFKLKDSSFAQKVAKEHWRVRKSNYEPSHETLVSESKEGPSCKVYIPLIFWELIRNRGSKETETTIINHTTFKTLQFSLRFRSDANYANYLTHLYLIGGKNGREE